MNDLFQLAKEKACNNVGIMEGIEIDLNLKLKILQSTCRLSINLKTIPSSSNNEISEDKSTKDLMKGSYRHIIDQPSPVNDKLVSIGQPKNKIILKTIPSSSNNEISEYKSTKDLMGGSPIHIIDQPPPVNDKLVSIGLTTKKTRSSLHNKESGRNKAKKKYGDGNTPEAIEKKRKTNVRNMNSGTNINPKTLRKYNITKADIIDVSHININVITYFNLNCP